MLLFLGAAIPSSLFALLLLAGAPALAQRAPVCHKPGAKQKILSVHLLNVADYQLHGDYFVTAEAFNAADDRGLLVGSQVFDIVRDPDRRAESAMGNLVADAMRLRYPGVDGALVSSDALGVDLWCAPTGTEAPGEIVCSELFALLPFGNHTVVLTLTGHQSEQAFSNGFAAGCNLLSLRVASRRSRGCASPTSATSSRPSPASGQRRRASAAPRRIEPTDAVRLVTNDFLAGSGDGYTVFLAGSGERIRT